MNPKDFKIRLITGYRKDQIVSIDGEEAHKAYYLFFNPDARTVFSSGLAIKGTEIERIEPDYQGTMGWNPTHNLDEDDYNEIRSSGVDRKLRDLLQVAQEVARIGEPKDVNVPLSQLMEVKYPHLQRLGGKTEETKLLS
jgi:hypothetical protein